VTDWNRIVHEHGPRVFATAWRILGQAADAEDVVQEVFLEVHRLWRTRPVHNWSGLLSRLAACRALDNLRRRKPAVSLDGLVLPGSRDDPEETAVNRELVERLRQAVAQLPPQEATVFCMRYFDEVPNHAIAAALDISPGAVGAALHKARGKLEALLAEAVAGD
jgi:RNA polymerase sigma-70 factor (ECF subfamily)